MIAVNTPRAPARDARAGAGDDRRADRRARSSPVSVSARLVDRSMGAYCASKAALEHAGGGGGVRVGTARHPGQRGRSGRHRDPDARTRHRIGLAGRRCSAARRSAGSAPPTTSPRRSGCCTSRVGDRSDPGVRRRPRAPQPHRLVRRALTLSTGGAPAAGRTARIRPREQRLPLNRSTRTWWSSAPGCPASTRSRCCASGACARRAGEGPRRRRHVVLEPLSRARAATSRASSTRSGSIPELEQEWVWTEHFASQPEIERYLNHLADRYDLRRDIRLVDRRGRDDVRRGHRHLGRSTPSTGERLRARFAVMATGGLSAPNRRRGRASTRSRARSCRRASGPRKAWSSRASASASSGTGSSGVQAIPELAKVAEHLTVFQRTAAFTWPSRNQPLTDDEQAAIKARYRELREEQYAVVQRHRGHDRRGDLRRSRPTSGASSRARPRSARPRSSEHGFSACRIWSDTATDLDANEMAVELFREMVRRTVNDPERRRVALAAGLPARVQASRARLELLRDLQPRQRDASSTCARTRSRRSRRRASAPSSASWSSTCSCSPPASTR